jgi:hypothetical protein
LAGTEEASTAARDQSISPARLSFSKMRRCKASHTPALCQARSLRQQVMPEQWATSNGRCSQGIAVYRTKRIPVSASRAPTGGRPPRGRAGSGGMSRAISAQSVSGRSCLAISQARPNMVNKWFC